MSNQVMVIRVRGYALPGKKADTTIIITRTISQRSYLVKHMTAASVRRVESWMEANHPLIILYEHGIDLACFTEEKQYETQE